MADGIKSFTINGVSHHIDYDGLLNKPVIPADKSAEIEKLKNENLAQKNLLINLAKLTNNEDRLALDLYPDYPVITFAADEGIVINSINKGNSEEAEAFPDFVLDQGKVVAYHKDGIGYDNGEEGNAQFNAFVTPVEGFGLYGETTYEGEIIPYNNIDALELADKPYLQVKVTKVTGNFTLQIKSCPMYNITTENYTDKELTCPSKFSSKASRCEFEIKVSEAVNPLTAASCGDVDILSIIEGAQNSKKTKWTYSFDPNNELVTGDIKLVFGTPVVE